MGVKKGCRVEELQVHWYKKKQGKPGELYLGHGHAGSSAASRYVARTRRRNGALHVGMCSRVWPFTTDGNNVSHPHVGYDYF
jgi:hypothetical protein